MKNEIATSAGLLALIGVVVQTALVPPAEPGTAPAKTEATRAKSPDGKPSSRNSIPYEGPWTATRPIFDQPEFTVPSCDAGWGVYPFCTAGQPALDRGAALRLFGFPAGSEIHVIIATVADPNQTRLALFTDRQIEALQRALQAGGWDFASQWLPWNDAADPKESDVRERLAQRSTLRTQQQLPGLLLFRRVFEPRPPSTTPRLATSWLAVFVVGETPTAGISPPAFDAALHFASALLATGDGLGILGPNFSGSFDSLARLLLSLPPGLDARRIVVRGGTTTSATRAASFTKSTGIQFASGLQNSSTYSWAFCDLLRQHGIPPRDAAYLTEDETAFGVSRTTREPTESGDSRTTLAPTGLICPAVPVYHYSRDVAHLRNAYREETGQTLPVRGMPLQGPAFTLQDPTTGEDSIPSYSHEQTPQSQNAVIDQLASEFRRRGIRLVNLVATNVLDELFLTRVIRQRSPDTRVLVPDADVMFIAATSSSSLAGTLFLSTYPITVFLDSQASYRDHTVFPSMASESVYNVTGLLLKDLHLIKSPFVLRDYKDPSDPQSGHPPLWLMTVSRYGFLPLEIIHPEHKLHEKFLTSIPSSSAPFYALRPPRSWLFLELFLALFTFLACVAAWRANRPGSQHHRPRWLNLAYGNAAFPPRWFSLIALLLLLSLAHWVLALPLWVTLSAKEFAPDNRLAVPCFAALAALAFLAPIVVAGFVTFAWRPRFARARTRSTLAVLAVSAASVLIAAAWWFSCDPPAPYADIKWEGRFFRFRCFEIYSGLSPAVPVLVLLLGFFVIAWSLLRRHTAAGVDRPRLPIGKKENNRALARQYHDINLQILSPLHLDKIQWRLRALYCVLIAGAALGLLHRGQYLSSFESIPYNFLLISSELALFCFLCLGTYDFVQLWALYEKFLTNFDASPLMTGFIRVSRGWPRRAIWSLWPTQRHFNDPAFARQSLIALHNRKILATSPGAASQFERFRTAYLNTRDATQSLIEEPGFFASRRAFRAVRARIGAELLQGELYQYWTTHVVSESPDHTPAAEVSPEDASRNAATDYVALQIARYVIYVAAQIQQIAWTLSVTLLVVLVAFNTYSPHAPQTVGRLLAAAFLVLGFFVVRAFASLERNRILSRISGTRPGKLNWEFYLHVTALGVLPLLGVLYHLFPSLGDTLMSWVAPTIANLR